MTDQGCRTPISGPLNKLPVRNKILRRGPKSRFLRTDERGATMVEFAFFFILFLLLTVGLMELGRAVWTYTTLASAARQGARFAQVFRSVNGSPVTEADIKDVVGRNAIGLGLDLNKVEVTWWEPVFDSSGNLTGWTADPEKKRGSTVEVRVRHTFELVTSPLILQQGSLELGSTSRMIVAN